MLFPKENIWLLSVTIFMENQFDCRQTENIEGMESIFMILLPKLSLDVPDYGVGSIVIAWGDVLLWQGCVHSMQRMYSIVISLMLEKNFSVMMEKVMFLIILQGNYYHLSLHCFDLFVRWVSRIALGYLTNLIFTDQSDAFTLHPRSRSEHPSPSSDAIKSSELMFRVYADPSPCPRLLSRTSVSELFM